jgi:hypothetical protein
MVAASLLVGLFLVGCATAGSSPGNVGDGGTPRGGQAASSAVPSTPTDVPPNPTAMPSPTALPATPLPPSRVPPTPTSTPAPLAMRISAELDPPTPRAGLEFILRLTVANDGDRVARGLFIATSGPWERWTVLEVQPAGTFARDAAGWHIVSPLEVPPRDARTLDLRVRADEPAEEQLTFAVREAEPGELL